MSAYFDIFPKLLSFFSEIYVFSIAHFKLEKEKLEKNQKVMTKKYPKHTNLFKSWEGEKGKFIFQAFKITCGTQSQQKKCVGSHLWGLFVTNGKRRILTFIGK